MAKEKCKHAQFKITWRLIASLVLGFLPIAILVDMALFRISFQQAFIPSMMETICFFLGYYCGKLEW